MPKLKWEVLPVNSYIEILRWAKANDEQLHSDLAKFLLALNETENGFLKEMVNVLKVAFVAGAHYGRENPLDPLPGLPRPKEN